MTELQIFNFERNEVRTFLIGNEPYFVANDVAKTLGYLNPSKATNDHCKKHMKLWGNDSLGRRQEFKVIPESDVYRLVFRSKLPEAERFEDWVTNDVLPSIRKNGGFQVSNDPWDTLTLMFEASKQTKEEVDEVKTRVVNLEENVSIDPGKYSYIGKCISRKVRQVGKERQWSMNKKQIALLYKDINKAVTEVSGVRTRSQLREKHFDDVMDLIDDWEPSTATRMLIHNLEDEEAFPIEEEG